MALRIHIVGRKNSGKTTLVCDLVRELTSRGMKIATVKHTHHHHELDTPGKDSFKHHQAGAAAVGILSPRMTALFVPSDRELVGEHRYSQFDVQFSNCDFIIVEGDLNATSPRIEVWRSEVCEEPCAVKDGDIVAVVSDDATPDLHCPVWSRADLSSIADWIIKIRDDRNDPDLR